MSVLKITDVTKVFANGNVVAVDTFSLDVADGEPDELVGAFPPDVRRVLRLEALTRPGPQGASV